MTSNLNKILTVILLTTVIGKVNSMEVSPEIFGMTKGGYRNLLTKSINEELTKLKEKAWPERIVTDLTRDQMIALHLRVLGGFYEKGYSKILNKLKEQDFSKEEDVFSWDDIVNLTERRPPDINMQRRDEKPDIAVPTESANQKIKKFLNNIFRIK